MSFLNSHSKLRDDGQDVITVNELVGGTEDVGPTSE